MSDEKQNRVDPQGEAPIENQAEPPETLAEEVAAQDAVSELEQARKKRIENFSLQMEEPEDQTGYGEPGQEDDDVTLYSAENSAAPGGAGMPNGNWPTGAPGGADESQELQSYSDGLPPEGAQKMQTPMERKAEREAAKADKKRRKKKAKKNGCLFKMIWMVMIVLVSVVLAQYILVGVNDMLAVNREEHEVTIDIPSDATLDQVTDIMYQNGMIDRPDFFKLYAHLTKDDDTFSRGTYQMRTNMDYEAILNYIRVRDNRTDKVDVQFTEGMTLMEYGALLEEKEVCTQEEFLEACNTDTFDEDYPFLTRITNKAERYYKLEGYLFPDTYTFYKDENPLYVVETLLINYEDKIVDKHRVTGYTEKVSIEDIATERLMSMEDVLTLASLVQAEAIDQDDMRIIAGIFLNRLDSTKNEGVSYLQSDPTMYYPYKQSTVPSGFTSRYDTYDIEGLPPGPICNPGMDAIDAVLHPQATNYFYFCHGTREGSDEIEVLYATTYEQHQQNLRILGLAE